MTSQNPLLELSNITKTYGGLTANDAISMAVNSGEVVAMLGENGAGKSTLMKIVYGLVRADLGSVSVAGTTVVLNSPRDAIAAGIGMVTQEFSLVETMTVAENVALSGTGYGRVNIRAIRQQVLDTMERVGVHIDPDALVSTLSIGERQRVEIVKALFHECRVLILDEPTAVLTPQDIRSLFSTIERLSSTGMGVLFVSHKLREVAEISDRVVVLRKGKLVSEERTCEIDMDTLAARMMGTTSVSKDDETSAALGTPVDVASRVDKAAQGIADPEADPSTPVLAVSGMSVSRDGRTVLDSVDVRVRSGQIVGVAGISGNGQTELMDALTGAATADTGTIEVNGTNVTGQDVAARLKAGLGRLTEDRRGSVIASMSVEYNLVIEDLGAFKRRGFLDKSAIRAHAEKLIDRYSIRARPTDAMATLSGGNIQKVLLARALARNPKIVVVAQPTRGLDVGSYHYVHDQLKELRDAGAGILVISEDLDELRGLSDRISVLFRGRLSEEIPVEEATSERLGLMMTGEQVAS